MRCADAGYVSADRPSRIEVESEIVREASQLQFDQKVSFNNNSTHVAQFQWLINNTFPVTFCQKRTDHKNLGSKLDTFGMFWGLGKCTHELCNSIATRVFGHFKEIVDEDAAQHTSARDVGLGETDWGKKRFRDMHALNVPVFESTSQASGTKTTPLYLPSIAGAANDVKDHYERKARNRVLRNNINEKIGVV